MANSKKPKKENKTMEKKTKVQTAQKQQLDVLIKMIWAVCAYSVFLAAAVLMSPTGVQKKAPQTLESKALQHISQTYDIDSKTLKHDGTVYDNNKQFIYFTQEYQGIPVYNSRSVVYVNKGNYDYVKLNYREVEDLDVNQTITETEATTAIKNSLASEVYYEEIEDEGRIGHSDLPRPVGYYDITGEYQEYDFSAIDISTLKTSSSKLIIYSSGTKNYFAYKIDLPLMKELPAQFTFFVDAASGEVIDFKDNLMFYDISGTVTGMEWEDPFTDGIQLEKPLPSQYVDISGQQVITDNEGNYSGSGTSLSALLQGSWVNVYNDQLEESQHTFAPVSDTVHDWNWDADDTSYLDEESNVFYQVNRIFDYITGIGAHEMIFNMTANVNIDQHCNAYYSTEEPSVNFFEAGNGCESTGVISDVILHEYGHGIVHELNPALLEEGYWDQSGNIHEAIADYWACTVNDNPDQGEGFHIGDPNGLRICNSDDRYPEDYNPEPHSGCQILSGALWDVREEFSKEVLDPMIVQALRLLPINYVEILESLLVVDDDNGDLSDGTPQIASFCDAFWDHGIFSQYCLGHTSSPVAIIDSPVNGTIASQQINIVGTVGGADQDAFDRYTIEWGVGEDPTSWSSEGVILQNGGLQEMYNDTLGSVEIDPIEEDNYTIKLTVYTENSEIAVQVNITIDDTLQNGWPFYFDSVEGHKPETSPTIVDLDQNGTNEMLFASHKGQLYALQSDGTALPGWPVTLEHGNPLNYSGSSSVAVADINNDGLLEVVVVDAPLNGNVYTKAFDAQGNELWRKYMSTLFGVPGQVTAYTSPVIVNLDGDEELEIISGSYNKIFVLDHNGEVIPGWPVQIDNEYDEGRYYSFKYSAPAVADLDGDGAVEITILGNFSLPGSGSLMKLFAFSNNGYVLPGWPRYTGSYNTNSPSIGDIDDDGKLEIVLSVSKSWHAPPDEDEPEPPYGPWINAYEANGSFTDGWPMTINEAGEQSQINGISSAVLGDIDSDELIEVVAGTGRNESYIPPQHAALAVEGNGTVIDGWPAVAETFVKRSEAIIGDVSGNGILDIVRATYFRLNGWDNSGSVIDQFPKHLSGETSNNPAMGDLDGDGDIEVAIGDDLGYMYVWDLDALYDPEMIAWPMFRHDIQNTGNYHFGEEEVVEDPPLESMGTNPSFEIDDGTDFYPDWDRDDAIILNSIPDGYATSLYCDEPGCSISVTLDDLVKYHNNYSAKLDTVNTDAYLVQDIPVEYGRRYKVTGYVKTDCEDENCYGTILTECKGLNEAGEHEAIWSGCGLHTPTEDITRLYGDNDWTQIILNVNADNREAEFLRVACYNSPSADGTGTVWCDSFEVEDIGIIKPTEEEDTPSDTLPTR